VATAGTKFVALLAGHPEIVRLVLSAPFAWQDMVVGFAQEMPVGIVEHAQPGFIDGEGKGISAAVSTRRHLISQGLNQTSVGMIRVIRIANIVETNTENPKIIRRIGRFWIVTM
jgi:hypothetical protein